MKTSHAIILSVVAFAAFLNIDYSIGLSFGHNALKGDAPKIYDDGQTTKILMQNDSLYKKLNISTTPIVIEKYKLLLFVQEKIGSTVLKQLCRRIMGASDYYKNGGGKPHAPWVNGLSYLTMYPIETADAMLTSTEWVRAMFVRDPKERLLSAYLHWKPKQIEQAGLIVSAHLGLLNETSIPRTKNYDQLGNCCKFMSNGDPNWEVLCRNHLQTFEGFLDLVEDGHTPLIINSTTGRQNWSPAALRNAPSCEDKHWTPITQWRMERKFYPYIDFIGHLETALWDTHRLLDRLHPEAWELYGKSGWGKFRNESIFQSTGTVKHATNSASYLMEYYANTSVEERAELYNDIDYDNEYLELERLKVGEAEQFYKQRYIDRFGSSYPGDH